MSSKAINNDSPAKRERRQGEVVVLEEFEKLVADLAQPSYLFRVYVSGLRSRSVPAIAKLRGICDQYLPGRYELIIIDIEATHDSQTQSGAPRETEVDFPSGDSKCISVYVSLCEMNADLPSLCIVDGDLTQRKKRDELARSGRLATAILESTAEAIAVCDETGKIIRANRALEDLCGFNPLGQRFDSALPLEIARSEPGAPVLHLSISDALNGCVILRAKEVHFRRKDGRAFALLLTSAPIKDSSGVMGCIVTMTDVTERKRAKEQLKKLNRTLKAMSSSNKALLHATDESTYLQEVCRIITEDCGYLLTWIGFAENDEARTVRPAVYSGFEEGYLETLKIRWDDSERGCGPSGTAIRTGLPALCRNVLTDSAFTPWREEALKRGYLANLAVPIMEEERAVGVVSFYSREPDAFSEAETTLLMDLAADMAFGINTLRLRADHARAEKLLRAREAKYRELAEYVPALLWAADTNGVATYHNRRWHQYTGQPLERGRGNGWQDIVYPEDLQRAKERWSESVQTGKDFSIEYRLQRASDGAYRWHAVQGTLEKDEQGKPIGWYGNLIDIDDRKRAEEAQRNSERLYRALGESINYGVWMCAPDGRNTYVSESFLKLTGMTQQQCMDLGWGEALHPDDAERSTAAWKECMQTGEPWDVEQRYLGVDGRWHPILSRGVPGRDDE